MEDPAVSISIDVLPGDVPPFNIIRTETVLSRLPIHNLSKKGKVDIRITKKRPTGDLELKWEVSYSDRYGQPRQLAYKLDSLVINRRLDEEGRPLPKLIRIGSLKQICKNLGISENGKNARDIKTAFLQNATAFINANMVYRSTDGSERRLDAGFTRYGVVFTGETLPDGRSADAVYVILNDPYRDVVNQAPVRPLNYDYLRELRPASQRFYEIISYRIFASFKNNRPFARIAYSDYCLFSAQQRYYDYEHFRIQMYKVHRPHLESGYLADFQYTGAVDGEGKPDWVMSFRPGPRAQAEFETFTGSRPSTTEIIEATERYSNLIQQLVDRGISKPQAKKLLASLPETDPVQNQIDWADYLIAVSAPGAFRNPPGFYVSLIRDSICPPTWFTAARRPQTAPDVPVCSAEAPDKELRDRYERYRAAELDRYIEANISPEVREQAVQRKKRDFAAQYHFLPSETLDQISRRAVRSEFESEAPIMTFEQFRACSNSPEGSGP